MADGDLTELCRIVYFVHFKSTTVAKCDVNDFILRRENSNRYRNHIIPPLTAWLSLMESRMGLHWD